MTGGGDCPGLNPLIRSIIKRGILEYGYEFIGIENGYQGLVEPGLARPLGLSDVRGILNKGGTILGTSNKANPFEYAIKVDGQWVLKDMSEMAVQRTRELQLDGLIAIGGDGTLSMAHRLSHKGLNIIGCPKTIDNDLSGTDQTFGFDTARAICVEAIDRLHSTAESHDRVMIIELMGRHAGFLTCDSGVAGGADVILIPEIPYRLESVIDKIKRRGTSKHSFTIIAISEGAFPQGGSISIQGGLDEAPGRGVVRLGGSGRVLADLLAQRIEAEIRVTVLGHLQRGGAPTAADRLLATRYGCKALELIHDDLWGHMVALRDGSITHIPLSEKKKKKRIDPNGQEVRFAKSLGISFGD
jgi:6-phosphofructokinase 1